MCTDAFQSRHVCSSAQTHGHIQPDTIDSSSPTRITYILVPLVLRVCNKHGIHLVHLVFVSLNMVSFKWDCLFRHHPQNTENWGKLVMVSSSGQGVQAVTLLKFLTLGDPQQNCGKFIQLFKDWCELMDGTIPSLCHLLPKKEWKHYWLAKGKVMAAFHSAITAKAMKNSKTPCKAFSSQKRNGRNQRLFSNISRNIS